MGSVFANLFGGGDDDDEADAAVAAQEAEAARLEAAAEDIEQKRQAEADAEDRGLRGREFFFGSSRQGYRTLGG